MGKKVNSSWAQEVNYDDIIDELDEYEDMLDGAYQAIHSISKKDHSKEKRIKKFPKNVW